MHDLHIHTSLSSCARSNSEPEDYFRAIPERKLSIAGFSNHLWDSAIPGADGWYRPQNIEHLLPLKKQLAETSLPGTVLLFGCETEYTGGGCASLHPDHAGVFDYVLISAHHFHKPLVRPPGITGGEKLTALFVSRFLEVCEFGFAWGIVHPFMPFGFPGREKEIIRNLPDRLLEECFTAASERKKFVELNLSVICKLAAADALEDYKRVMQIARQCSCRFYMGSDAHGMCHFGMERFRAGLDFADACGIELSENPFRKI